MRALGGIIMPGSMRILLRKKRLRMTGAQPGLEARLKAQFVRLVMARWGSTVGC